MNVETMFDSRKAIWNGLGESIVGAKSSEEAIKLAGLDWNVEPKPIQIIGGNKIPNTFANVRNSDNSVLGIVTERYEIVQNQEAFNFTDYLLGEGVQYETAGSLSGGKRVWMLAKTDTIKILGDDITPYLVFTNSFDGKGSVKVALTPIRVVCQNTLTLALKKATRKWSVKHTGDIAAKIDEAREALKLTNIYMEELQKTADELTQITIVNTDMLELMAKLLPIQGSPKQQENAKEKREMLMGIYNNKDDIQRFKGTAYGAINAVADFESHVTPLRNTKTAKENKFMTVVDTSPLMAMASAYFGINK